MIIEVHNYTVSEENLPVEVFNYYDTKEQELLIKDDLKHANFYRFPDPEVKESDRYKRVVALSFIVSCTTSSAADLSEYGFMMKSKNEKGEILWEKPRLERLKELYREYIKFVNSPNGDAWKKGSMNNGRTPKGTFREYVQDFHKEIRLRK